MIDQQAEVVAITDDHVWLEVERQSTCSQCQVKQGCGTGMLAKHVGQRFSRVSIANDAAVTVGEQVKIAISEQALLKAAMQMYIAPLLFLLMFSAGARMFLLGSMAEIIFGLCGLFIGFYLVKQRLRNKKDGFQAKLVEVNNETK